MGNEIKIFTNRKRTINRIRTPYIGVSSGGRGIELFVSERELSRGHGRIAFAVHRVRLSSQVDMGFLKPDSVQGSECGCASAIPTIGEGECCNLFPA